MTNAVSTYADLQVVLAALPPTPPDRVRVYRGQTRDYQDLCSSGLRRSIRNQAIWSVYCQHLYRDLLPEAIKQSNDLTMESLQAVGIWFHALAQHYGPGSDFTDVTYSVDVALWFALHSIEEILAEGLIGPQGPPDPGKDHPTLTKLYGYKPWNEPGYLYVLDLPKWNGSDLAEPGVVIDLAEAPPIFSSSPRIRAQHGCLVYSRNKDSSALNLKDYLVPGTPLLVARPMTGINDLDRRVADLFPSPEVDEWYARLLSVPMNYSPEPPPKLRRAIPVSVYFDRGDECYNQETLYRNVCLPLPLLHRAFQDFDQHQGTPRPENLPPGVPIVLEAPLIFPYPTGDSDLWHHGLLASDLPDRCPYYEFGSDLPAGEVSLDNVLFEFSFLELTGWDRIVRENLEINILRGVWLRRCEDGFAAALVYQKIPGSGPEVFGFARLYLDQASQRWVLHNAGSDSAPLQITDDPPNAKALLVALMLLRHLSPVLKVDATISMATKHDEEHTYLVRCARDAGRLFRVKSPVCDWYVFRDALQCEEPFTHPSGGDGIIELKSKGSFRDIPAQFIREQALAAWGQAQPQQPSSC